MTMGDRHRNRHHHGGRALHLLPPGVNQGKY